MRLAAKNESRLLALEGWRAEKAGEERRLSTVSAGAGGVVAVIVRVKGQPPPTFRRITRYSSSTRSIRTSAAHQP
ncbi:hypothetical protein [Methanoculleus sp.]|uniref:hypothetical protein n=1 Tax=Methanoculleus sp. TaxID=90427 RepID=UPI0026095A75|nr:hypothetical protein [Methanoculleus sp.]MDI6867759.1 hypothetical protein [Methanoculleus sp.]